MELLYSKGRKVNKYMKKTTEKTFSTGEFAKLLGVNKDTLFYYDKIDLFKPAGTYDNGYRYYTIEQFDQFMAIHSLRTIELPIKELKTYFDTPSAPALQQLAMEQQEKIAREIQKLQDIQFFLERTVALTKEMEEVSVGEVFLRQLPAESIVYNFEKIDWSASMEALYEHSKKFIKQLGVKSLAAYGVVHAKDDFWHEGSGESSRLFCRLDDPTAQIKPAGQYAIIYHQGPYDEIPETFRKLLTHLKKEQLELDGDIYEEYLLHSIAAKEEKDYITKISVKVKPIR